MILLVLMLVLAAMLVIAGIAGLMLPAMPGAPLLFVGLVVAAWAEGFAYVGPVTLGVFALLALLTYVIDIVAGLLGARRFNASREATIGAGLGAIVGIFFGIPGLLFGPFAGAVAGEIYNRRNLREAGWSGIGATVGLLVGTALKLTLAFAMIGWFLFMRFGVA